MVRNLLKTQPKFAMAWNVFQYCTGLKIIGSIMIFVVLAIVGVTYYSVVISTYGPLLLSGDLHVPLAIFVLFIFHAFLAMLLWSYFATVITDPGSVPLGWKPFSQEDEMEAQRKFPSSSKGDRPSSETRDLIAEVSPLVGTSLHASSNSTIFEGSTSENAPPEQSERKPLSTFRRCGKCGGFKPPRTHHCSICRKCVLKMDHHCIWVVNCIGAKNYKFFLLFLMYTFLETTFSGIVLLPPFINFFLQDLENADPSESVAIFFSFVLNMAFSLSLLGFLIMHSQFVLRNTTTIESFEKKKGIKWKYDVGRRKNFEQVFGENPKFWFFPRYCPKDLQNMEVLAGIEYPKNDENLDPL